jgi:elongation factor G
MKEFVTEKIRNLGLLGHGSSGKTSFAEALAFNMKTINRMGKVEEGNTVCDYHEDEIERQISLGTSLMHGTWKDHKINVIDTPGYQDFYGDVVSSMRAVDLAMILVSAVDGIEVGTEASFKLIEDYDKPRSFIINKLDQQEANFDKVLEQLQNEFGTKVIPVQYPVHVGPGFDAVIDLMSMKMHQYKQDGDGHYEAVEIPAEFRDKASEARQQMIESIAEVDEELMEKFFDDALAPEDLKKGFHKGIIEEAIYPVLCSTSTHNVGIQSILDLVVDYFPSPNEMPGEKLTNGEKCTCNEKGKTAALVFKTVEEAHVGELSFIRLFSGSMRPGDDLLNVNRDKNERIGQIYALNGKNKESVEVLHAGDIAALVKLKDTHTGNTLSAPGAGIEFEGIQFPKPRIRTAIRNTNKGDEDKVANGLKLLHEEDPTFISGFDPELRQTIIHGQGELQFDVIIKRLKERFHVDVEMEEPRIPYREAIQGKAEAQGKYKKQSGGRGQYGDAHLRIEPLPRGTGFEFVDAIVGGVIPGKFIPAVEKGVIETMERGVLAGYKVIDVKATVFDGSYHNVDSSENAFKMAASMGFKKAFVDARPVILEPIYKITVKVPEQYMGDVMGDISSRRGKIHGMEADGNFQVITAEVPLAELYKYSTTLRSMTQGRGQHDRDFSHYEPVPGDVQQKIIEKAQAEKEEE